MVHSVAVYQFPNQRQDTGRTLLTVSCRRSSSEAINVLNEFLENHQVERRGRGPRIDTIEGSFDFRGAGVPFGRARTFDTAFSKGLPDGILATWEGAWQTVSVPGGPSAQSAVVLRLNGAVGTVRFSRPVVVRHLVLRPPREATLGGQLIVRARKSVSGTSREQWRSSYEFQDAALHTAPSACGVGDLISARYSGNGKHYLATLIEADNATATIRWIDNDYTHRLVPWSRIRTADGIPCNQGKKSDLDGTSVSARAVPKGSSQHPPFWRDLARRVRTVDELTFSIPTGAAGWLIGEISIAAILAPPQGTESSDDETETETNDPSEYMVRVYPGPYAAIEEVSRAAVIFNADDMLERGLRLRGTTTRHRNLRDFPESEDEASDVSEDESASSAQLKLSMSRSVEGMRQLYRALAEPGDGLEAAASLPFHVSRDRFLQDADRLARVLDASRADVKKYRHFEAFFAVHWDWGTPLDALQVTFEHWRHNPRAQEEAKGALYKGQAWQGSYFCTQGITSLSVEVTSVKHDAFGRPEILADLSFKLDSRKSQEKEAVNGAYVVSGTLDPAGRALVLDPVPGSWKVKPKNFVMVGLQGIVSYAGQAGLLRYAGSIPIYGCDSFELTAKGMMDVPVPRQPPKLEAGLSAKALKVAHQRALWNSALARLAVSLENSQKRWRTELQNIIAENDAKKNSSSSSSQNQMQQLLEAAQAGGIVIKTPDGRQIEVKLGN